MRFPQVFFLLFGFAVLTGATIAAAQEDYVLGPGDVVAINVYDFPDLTLEARISAAGTITYPLIGRIKIAGGSTSRAEDLIAGKLKSGGFVTAANVRVDVSEYASKVVSVLGQVAAPGKYPLRRKSSIIDVIAEAGGIKDQGGTEVTLIRQAAGAGKQPPVSFDLRQIYASGDLSGNLEVQNGDVIVVPRAPVVYVYGAVNAPGAYRLEPQMSVVQALSLAGGLSEFGSDSGLRLERRVTGGGTKVREVNLNDMVQADDVIFVRESVF